MTIPSGRSSFLLMLCLCLALCRPALGVEYFVALSGSDSNAGTDRKEPFATVQRGLDALAPGDTLTIAPGEYKEKVSRKGLGVAGRRTLIRAEIPGTVVLRGDVRAPEFRPVKGLPRVHVAEFEGSVEAVSEVDTLTLLLPVPTVGDLALHPGSYHYDAAVGKLYLSTSDLQPTDRHFYTVSVIGENGFFLEDPVDVTLEGIAVTGFNTSHETGYTPGNFSIWGILFFNPTGCVIRACTVYLNGGGIAVTNRETTSRNNVIEDCVAYGNDSPFSGSGGNILMFTPNDGTIRRCLAYHSKRFGLRLYGQGMEGTNVIEDSLGWGNLVDLFIKGGGALGTARRSVAAGTGNVRNIDRVLVGIKNGYLKADEWPADSIHLPFARPDLNEEFADPENFDYRLQATSRYRGAGPEGSDQGPYPYRADVFFVRPGGDDEADGLSLRHAWKTVARAVRDLRPGATLYIEPGVYEEEVALRAGVKGKPPVTLRGRGKGEVLLKGKLTIENSSGVVLERIAFHQPVEVRKGSDLRFANCRFDGTPEGLALHDTMRVRVEHGAFTRFTEAGLRLKNTEHLYLSGNFFDNRKGVAIALGAAGEKGVAIDYCDYNVYTRPDAAAARDGKPLPRGQWPHDRYASLAVAGEEAALLGRGALGKPAGPYRDALEDAVFMSKPVVHSLTDTTANLEWVVSGDKLICGLAWGETQECENQLDHEVKGYGSFSLTGLKPDTTYYFRIRDLRYPYSQTRRPGPAYCPQPEFDVISFTTAAKPAAPREYFVAPDGKDDNDGLSRATAWRSVAYAAGQVRPGDTVSVAGGTYPERVHIRTTGEKGAPITFRSLPGERVEFASGEKLLEESWVINGKAHIRVDGFYFSQFRNVGGNQTAPRVFSLYGSRDVAISRCFYDARGRGYAPGFLTVRGGSDVAVSNCVMISGFNSIGVSGCPGFRLEHCVVVVPMIQATMIGAGDQPHLLRNNIFTDSSAYKVKVHLHEWKGQNDITDKNNVYFLRVPDKERELYWMLSFQENGEILGHTRMSLEAYRQRVGKTDSLVADPRFAGLVGKSTKSGYAADAFISGGTKWDFPDFYATNPEVVRRGIGLQPERFCDFHFHNQREAVQANHSGGD